ncbi:MAG TPA: hypothetical protein DHW42_04685 [Candidatus Marinimicrobia bacterium]|nr:hypothetical protein [Candidatus Neomarinimicrobiota bacterium]
MSNRNPKVLNKLIENQVEKLPKSQRQFLRSLHQKKYRYQTGRFLIEGLKLIKEAVLANFPLESVYIAPSLYEKLNEKERQLLDIFQEKIHFVTTRDIQQISTLSTPEGIIAVGVIDQPVFKTDNNLSFPGIYLWEINDPGNLGAIMRTARWFGVKNITLSPNSVDIYSPKVVRSSMGSLFFLSGFQNVPFEELCSSAKQNNVMVFAADMSGTPLQSPPTDPWVLVMGSESHGLPPHILTSAVKTIGIPRYGSGESLNLSISAGILIYQLIHSERT